MKCVYIKPLTEIIDGLTVTFIAGSTDGTNYYVNPGDSPTEDPIDDNTEPDPSGGNSGAKKFWGSYDIWED